MTSTATTTTTTTGIPPVSLNFESTTAWTELVFQRCLALILLFAVSILIGVVPMFYKHHCRQKKLKPFGRSLNDGYLLLLVCYSGGVLFGLVFLILIPEARASCKSAFFVGSPWPEVVGSITFMGVCMFRELILVVCGEKATARIENAQIYYVGIINSVVGVDGFLPMPDPVTIPSSVESMELDSISTWSEMEDMRRFDELVQVEHAREGNIDPRSPRQIRVDAIRQYRVREHYINYEIAGLTAVLLMVLSLQSALDGLCLGVQPTTWKTWRVFLCLALHRYTISFITGWELVAQDFTPKTVFLVVTVYSALTPIGGIIGALSDAYFNDNEFLRIFFNAVSAGSLLYVVVFELFKTKKNNLPGGRSQYFIGLVGYSTVLYFYFDFTGIAIPEGYSSGMFRQLA